MRTQCPVRQSRTIGDHRMRGITSNTERTLATKSFSAEAPATMRAWLAALPRLRESSSAPPESAAAAADPSAVVDSVELLRLSRTVRRTEDLSGREGRAEARTLPWRLRLRLRLETRAAPSRRWTCSVGRSFARGRSEVLRVIARIRDRSDVESEVWRPVNARSSCRRVFYLPKHERVRVLIISRSVAASSLGSDTQ